MEQYKNNVTWLTWIAPFRSLSISAAYLTPFFLGKGLSLAEVFLLQSIFSFASVLWELPSGYFADRIGHAKSIKISVPIAAVALMAYGFADEFWQFAVLELALAISVGLVSGVDSSLLYNSLKAQGKQADFVRSSQRIQSAGYASVAAGVPIAFVLVGFVGIQAALVADGLLTFVGLYFALKLREAPHYRESHEVETLSAVRATKQLLRSSQSRWLMLLGAVLSTATYLGFWLSAPYFLSMGVPIALFGAILAVRSLWKAWLSHRFHSDKHVERNMVFYAALACLTYVAMATQQIWLLWAVLAHDVVQALHAQPITAKLNDLIGSHYRATLNSVNNLVRRLFFAAAGPVVGLVADKKGLQTAFLVIALVTAALSTLALTKLHNLKVFNK